MTYKLIRSGFILVSCLIMVSCHFKERTKENSELSKMEQLQGEWKVDKVELNSEFGGNLMKAALRTLSISFEKDSVIKGKFSFMGLKEEESGQYWVSGDTLTASFDNNEMKLLIDSLGTKKAVLHALSSDIKDEVNQIVLKRK